MVLERLAWHCSQFHPLPPTQIGFRSHLCTQDAMMLIYDDVYAQPSRVQLRTIVGQICLHLNGKPVPRPRYLRVLGFWLQDDGKWNVWLSRLHTQLNNIYHVLQRIARSNQGFREDQLRRVTEALVYSRVMYHGFRVTPAFRGMRQPTPWPVTSYQDPLVPE
ncbi:hypothetical protein HPB47_013672 [Ixodes persulcatus]|uniref:Uncharacterized protein n=1 Tax=Ixodes persulcatus TaxID=34615 RepID=A0AC60QZA5_IXOPE|nr:hypothetical protein HPB47_013672 [Ixodes persulcatus]